MKNPNWQKYAGEYTLRPIQIDVLNRIYACEQKVVLVQGPTGIGKSLIQLVYSRWVKENREWTGYLVTPQRTLQNQLESIGVTTMRGVANYRCPHYAKTPYNHSNDHICPFYTAVNKAKKADLVAHNYSSMLHQRAAFKPRKLLMLDEGHRALEMLGLFFELELSSDALRNFKVPRNADARTVLDCILGADRQNMWRPEQRYILERVQQMRYWYSGAGLLNWDRVWQSDTQTVKIVPTRLTPASSQLLQQGKEKIIILTATVLNRNLFAAEMGIRDAAFIDVPSPFPAENRPIVLHYCGKMSRAYSARTLPRVLDQLRKDAASHQQEAGMVHTVSYRLAREICEAWQDERILQLPNGPDRDVVISDFLAGRLGSNRILVGPGLGEGIDALDDAARWQAIVKCPYPSMGDPRVKAIFERSKRLAWPWYNWKTAQTLVQTIGRVCRHVKDRGVTYIYDSACDSILRGPNIPSYVKEAIRK